MTGHPRIVAALTAVLAGVAAPAAAAWLVSSSGASAHARAGTLGAVGTVTTSVTDKAVTLGWAAVTTGTPPGGYTVRRTAPTAAVVCDDVETTTCTDTGLTAGTTYAYAVSTVRGKWSGTPATASATTLAMPIPAGSDVQSTSDADGLVERDETVAFTYNQAITPGSIIAGWTGASRVVYVQVADGGPSGNDTLSVFADSGYTTVAHLGLVDLGRTDYVSATARFGPTSGQTSTLVMSGSTVTLRLGARQSGTVTAAGGTAVLVWVPSASASAAAGGAVLPTPVAESGTLDRDF